MTLGTAVHLVVFVAYAIGVELGREEVVPGIAALAGVLAEGRELRVDAERFEDRVEVVHSGRAAEDLDAADMAELGAIGDVAGGGDGLVDEVRDFVEEGDWCAEPGDKAAI